MTNDTNDYDDFPASYSSELTDQLLAAALFTENRTLTRIDKEMYAVLLERTYQEIMMKVNSLTERTASYPHSQPIIGMLLKKLMRFIKHKTHSYNADYFRVLAYQLELAKKLEKIDWNDHEINGFPPVDEVLIYMNYNSKTYIKMLEDWLEKRIEAEANPIEQMEKRNYYQKAFSQLQRKPDIILYSDYTGLTEVMNKWFQHETEFLSNRLQLYITAKETKIERRIDKIRWMLSSDQIALMIRAAVASGLISEQSMNSVFNFLVRHISSEQTDDLSPSAMRSRSYSPEQTDKDVAIKWLQKMSKLIEGF